MIEAPRGTLWHHYWTDEDGVITKANLIVATGNNNWAMNHAVNLVAKTFIDGIALGQVTPGPIVITATFIGYQLCGLAGAVVGTIAIFSPSFVFLVLAVPSLDRLQHSPVFRRAMRGAMLSFVGLLLSTTVRFGLAAHWCVPSALLAALAFAALLVKIDIFWVIVLGAAASVAVL